jgi:hypothetical protein
MAGSARAKKTPSEAASARGAKRSANAEAPRGNKAASPTIRTRRAKKQQPLEHRLLLTATFCLLAGGAVMVYSASSARTLLE